MVKLFVGLDISIKDYKAVILDQEGNNAIRPFSFDNNQPGASELCEAILQCCKKLSVEKLYVGLESTSVYGSHIQFFVADSPELRPYHPSVICFNPKIIEKFKKSLDVDPYKDDWVDANAIAERLRFGRLPKSSPVDFRYLALQRLTRHRYHIIQNIIREKCYYLSLLFLKFNGLCQETVFSDNFGACAMDIIDEYDSTEDIAKASLDELIDFLINNGKDRFKDPKKVAESLKQAASNSYRLNSHLNDSLSFVLRSCKLNISAIKAQLTAVDKAIEKQVQGISNEYLCLKSVKGIGPVLAAGIIAEIGGISRFTDENALAKFSGIYWNRHQSGSFDAEDLNIKRSGNSYLRYYIVQVADQLRKYLPEYTEYYSRKFKESKKHHHKRALTLTARKTVRLVFALLREEKLYKSPVVKGVDTA